MKLTSLRLVNKSITVHSNNYILAFLFIIHSPTHARTYSHVIYLLFSSFKLPFYFFFFFCYICFLYHFFLRVYILTILCGFIVFNLSLLIQQKDSDLFFILSACIVNRLNLSMKTISGEQNIYYVDNFPWQYLTCVFDSYMIRVS